MLGKRKAKKEKPMGKHRRLKKLAKRTGIGIGIFLLVIFIIYMFPISDHVPKTKKENQQLYELLAKGGINDAVIDYKDKSVLVAFDLPPELNQETVEIYALGSAITIAPTIESVRLIEYKDKNRVLDITITRSDINDLLDSKIELQKLKEKSS